jgi:hypothetical protein
MGVRVNPAQRKLNNVYRTYVDVINFVKTDKKRFNIDTNKKEHDGMEIDEGENE